MYHQLKHSRIPNIINQTEHVSWNNQHTIYIRAEETQAVIVDYVKREIDLV